MSDEISRAVEGTLATVVYENDHSVPGLVLEDFLKEGLTEAGAARDVDGVEFLLSAEINEIGRGRGGDGDFQIRRFKELGGFAFGFFENAGKNIVRIESRVAAAEGFEGFFRAEGTALAASDMIQPEQSTARARHAVHQFRHGQGRG